MCLCMYQHVLVQLFLFKPQLVREELLTHISNINTSLHDSDVRKCRRGKGLLLRKKELVWVLQRKMQTFVCVSKRRLKNEIPRLFEEGEGLVHFPVSQLLRALPVWVLFGNMWTCTSFYGTCIILIPKGLRMGSSLPVHRQGF